MTTPKPGHSTAKSVPPSRVATDPKMRADHTCIREDCGKPLPKLCLRHEDPFCSTVCCRIWYGAER